jgi:hypothetical protein
MSDWNPGAVRLAPGELEPDAAGHDEHRKPRQVQWGRAAQMLQGGIAPQRLVSLRFDDENEPIRGFIVTCSINRIGGGIPVPVYRIVAGVGAITQEWPLLAPGTYILYAQSVDVYVAGSLLGAIQCQAWAGYTQAAPTLVLP